MSRPTGRPPGRPKLVGDDAGIGLSLWITARDYDTLAKRALESGVSVSQMAKRALAAGLRRREDPDHG